MQDHYQPLIDQLETQISQTKLLLQDPEMLTLAQGELERLESQKQDLLMAQTAMEQPETEVTASVKTNCTIEIRQGTGGEEAKIWADDLHRMYLRFCERHSLKLEFVDEMVMKIKGKIQLHDDAGSTITFTPYQLLQFETGVHRVQRVPETEAQGRIHTSTATVAILPEVPKAAVTIRDEDLEWQFIRAGGAGGQSVNKTSSAVRLTHTPSGIMVSARSERSQAQNREIALDLLRAQLWEQEEEKRLVALGKARAGIGQAKRAEKIRTYNYPQNRVTDHRCKLSWHNLPEILDGGLDTLLLEVATALNAESEASPATTPDVTSAD